MTVKEITLPLNQNSIYMLACFQLGQFFNEESTAEDCMIYINNVGILKNNMEEATLKVFAELSKQFESKHEEIKERFADNLDELEAKMQVILYGK